MNSQMVGYGTSLWLLTKNWLTKISIAQLLFGLFTINKKKGSREGIQMLWVQQKGNLSLFSTNTDGCCSEWRLVLVKHDKVRDDTPLVTKVWRSSNASAVAFSQPRQPLVHISATNKGKLLRQAFKLVLFCCGPTEVEKWLNEQNIHSRYHVHHNLLYFHCPLLLIFSIWRGTVVPLGPMWPPSEDYNCYFIICLGEFVKVQ